MKSENYSSKIQEIKIKVQKLVSLHLEVQKLNRLFRDENSQLKATIEQQKSTLKEMNDKIKTIQVSKSLPAGENETREMKLRINELIREVDKCLTLLNN